jgi:chromosome partitioning protein
MAAIIAAVVNEKGGVGKTTSTYALGTAFARAGLRTLMVDMDPQRASLTLATGVSRGSKSVADAIQAVIEADRDAGEVDTAAASLNPDALAPHTVAVAPNLDLIPSGKELTSAEHVLRDVPERDRILAEVLAPAADAYDIILIDCPPSLGVLVVNAMGAAQTLIIPVSPEYLSAGSLEDLFDTVRRVKRRRLNPTLSIAGIILTDADLHTTHAREITQEIRAQYGADLPILGVVKHATEVNNAAQAGRSIVDYAPKHPAALAYTEIADALLHRWQRAAPTPAPTTATTEPTATAAAPTATRVEASEVSHA